MRPLQEIIDLMALARSQGCKSIEVDGIKYEIGQIPVAQTPVPDVKPEDIVSPMSVLDEYSDEELKYYATPYFDQIQREKEAHRQKLIEEQEERSG